jgi:hypothetical protein
MTVEECVPLPGEHEEFQGRVRALLEESVERIDGRVRSRLNRARHAALEARQTPVRRLGWTFGPAGAVAATVLVALGLFSTGHLELAPPRPLASPAASVSASAVAPTAASTAPAIEDLELIADNDAIELPNPDDYDFYEWAAEAGAKSGGAEIGS